MNMHEDFRYYQENNQWWIEELVTHLNSRLWVPTPSGFDYEYQAINEIKKLRAARKQFERNYKYVD